MKGFVVVLLALVLAGLAAWFYYARSEAAPPPGMTEAEMAQIEAEVLSVGNQWLAGVNEANPEVFLDLFDSSGTHATDGYHYANYEEWETHVRQLFSNWDHGDRAWVTTRVDVFAPDAAMLVGHIQGTRTRTDGTTTDSNTGVTLLTKKSGAVWKLIYQGTAGRRTPAEEG